MKTKLFNTKASKEIRRELRQSPISCEAIMWLKLRNSKIGYKFRRQYGVGKYIVDFFCPELKLVIEIDGATHCTEDEIMYDTQRQKFLEEKGLIVKRYLNIDIKNNLSEVMHDLQSACERLVACKENQPHPSPLLVKERGNYGEFA